MRYYFNKDGNPVIKTIDPFTYWDDGFNTCLVQDAKRYTIWYRLPNSEFPTQLYSDFPAAFLRRWTLISVDLESEYIL